MISSSSTNQPLPTPNKNNKMPKSLNGTIDIRRRDYVSLFIFVLLISICISLLRDLTNLFVRFQARETRLVVPNDTLRQIFFDLEYSNHHLGRPTMGDVRVIGENFELWTNGADYDKPLGELLAETDWEDDEVHIIFDAGDF
jgi:hypothetical protein